MWGFIQVLLIVILLMGIILLAKPLYAQLGRPKVHFTRKWKRNLFYSFATIAGIIILAIIVSAGMDLWWNAHSVYTIPPAR